MPPRLYLEQPLAAQRRITLAAGPSRHVQVLRLQPGDAVTVFDGNGGEWAAQIARIGRSEVEIDVGRRDDVDRELACAVTLALGMPANDRMDALVEKATELGVARIQPLLCERSVLRLSGERAHKRVAHWRGVAVSASEQCGRTRVPHIGDVLTLGDWLSSLATESADGARFVLSLRDAVPFGAHDDGRPAVLLSGPEGGLAESEEAAARAAGFTAVSLGARVLRADTAPLAAMAAIALAGQGRG